MMVQKVTVIGAGTMGHGIAGQAAWRGYDVILFDPSAEALQAGYSKIKTVYTKGVSRGKMTEQEMTDALSRISLGAPALGDHGLAEAVREADLVIEAAPEKIEIKQAIFTEVEKVVSPSTILATNTSSLSISLIASMLQNPKQVIGMHFFNPVAVMPLLEIVRGEETSEEVVQTIRGVGETLLKTPIVVKDSPGFATSRLGIALGNEAMRIYEEGVASAQDIDRAMVLGYRHPIGPLALTDLVGLDVRLAISEYLYEKLGTDCFKPPKILKDKVSRGNLGKKTGQGFYTY